MAELRETLEKLYYDKVDYRSNVTIVIILNEIKSLIKSKLPEEKKIEDLEFPHAMDYSRGFYVGFNSCRTEIEKIVENL